MTPYATTTHPFDTDRTARKASQKPGAADVKVEARLFLGVAVFCWLAAIGYGIWTRSPTASATATSSRSASPALILSGGLLGISGSFFWFVSRRIDPRPEDRSDAEIAEAAGELGFFSPGSYWPVGDRRRGHGDRASALAFVQVWLLIVGVVFILFTVGGLLFEYYIGGTPPAALMATRGFVGQRRERDPRLPPGQYDTGSDFPVLTAEATPRLDPGPLDADDRRFGRDRPTPGAGRTCISCRVLSTAATSTA